MTQPTISVIVPVYNMERTLRRALDSIAAQKYTNYEVILIDDGSTDSSGSICDEYASAHDKFRVVHKKNGGQSSARNAGIVESLAPRVTFCDADDYVYPDWLANFGLDSADGYDLITQGMRADKPAFGHGELRDESGFEFIGDPIEFMEKAYEYTLVGYTVIKAFRKDIIVNYGLKFDERLWLREDDAFLFEYLSHCSTVKSVSKAGYFYFTPDWKKKYRTTYDDRLLLEEKIFESLNCIRPSAYRTQIAIQNRNAINRELTEAFYETKKIKYVKKLHAYFRKHPDFATISGFTRKAIQFDPSFLFSSLILYLHMSLRHLLGMGGAKDKIFSRTPKR